jgi:hypothetical protein
VLQIDTGSDAALRAGVEQLVTRAAGTEPLHAAH